MQDNCGLPTPIVEADPVSDSLATCQSAAAVPSNAQPPQTTEVPQNVNGSVASPSPPPLQRSHDPPVEVQRPISGKNPLLIIPKSTLEKRN